MFFSGRFYDGDKFSFPLPLINRTHRAQYVFDILRRAIPVIELHADTWAVYTRSMMYWERCVERSVGLRVAYVRFRRDETRYSLSNCHGAASESTFHLSTQNPRS